MVSHKKIEIFVPGRLCLFGEHSDWAGLHRMINADIIPGAAIVTGIEQGIYAEVEKSEHFTMHNESAELADVWTDFNCQMKSDELRTVAASDGYFAYVAGVASYVKDHYHVGGLKITIKKMTLPMKKGLSSSAAICVLVARTFNLLYKLNLNTMGEMNIAFKGEQRTRSRCGRLDQVCAFGIVPVCLRFDGDDTSVERLTVKGNLYWVFADLNAKKDTIKILSDLNKCYPFAENEKERDVHEALGKRNAEIIERAIGYMRNGEAELLGSLMTEAQEVFDTMVAPASLDQLTAPKLHSFLRDENIRRLSYGGKGVGSQGDGSIQFLAKDGAAQKELYEYLERQGLSAYTLTITPKHRIRKAVVPVAGFGTRLYPATRYMKKEMMPLVDKDGLLKPAILILLEQLCEAGIEEICLVTGSREEWETYQSYFQGSLSGQHREKLSAAMLNYEEKILEIGKKLTYRVQSERLGFGHAVYQCRDFCGYEAVLLLLGDTLYSSERKNCSLQMIEAYEGCEQPIIGIHTIPLEQVRHYGVVAGEWEDNAHTRMKITKFIEKPIVECAEKELVMRDESGAANYYSVFGQYILTSEVFEVLERNIQDEESESGEIGMTEALAECIGKGLTGLVIDGKMHDIGNAGAYKAAMVDFIK
jgi:UTP-glucose-1-phosphate uridylyltransferase/mevalonate kinase